ncbi:MCE family protein [Williamsia deligens]|uniref:MCE family protein n=1 Tax=Williamsia deligens TaxID=321325 RepID=A0ABW3G6I4_9NOCA|nr:MCE family protein [Williamsia deligens]MCP2194578.1 phospholipid/cholesterol/gamma-HCH transport system substrate-binding protein [Williamsia deligens]
MRRPFGPAGVRAVAGGAVTLAGAMLMTACSAGIYSVPLPGGADTGDQPRTYKVQFADVLDLVPQSAVKVDGVTVGKVKKIEIAPDQWSAQVEIQVKKKIDLSQKATANVAQTNLLGEKFISLVDPPENANAPRQAENTPIGTDRTRTATDIEQVLGALSMLLNGGGIAQITPIVNELNKALGGREGTVKSLLNQTQRLIRSLDEQKNDITRAIDGLGTLSARTAQQTQQIDRILNQLPAGVKVLEDQRPQFVTLLQKLDGLGQVGVDILGRAREEIITDLRALRPTLSALAASAPDFITAAPLLFTYPFPDDLLPGVRGDSTNLFLSVDLRLLNSLEALGVGQPQPRYVPVGSGPQPKVDPRNPYYNGNGPRLGYPTITLLPLLNARPGPNTPPSGGQYSLLPAPKQGQTALTAPAAMLGAPAKEAGK